jgi:hypothetical protein
VSQLVSAPHWKKPTVWPPWWPHDKLPTTTHNRKCNLTRVLQAGAGRAQRKKIQVLSCRVVEQWFVVFGGGATTTHVTDTSSLNHDGPNQTSRPTSLHSSKPKHHDTMIATRRICSHGYVWQFTRIQVANTKALADVGITCVWSGRLRPRNSFELIIGIPGNERSFPDDIGIRTTGKLG